MGRLILILSILLLASIQSYAKSVQTYAKTIRIYDKHEKPSQIEIEEDSKPIPCDPATPYVILSVRDKRRLEAFLKKAKDNKDPNLKNY